VGLLFFRPLAIKLSLLAVCVSLSNERHIAVQKHEQENPPAKPADSDFRMRLSSFRRMRGKRFAYVYYEDEP
jgi:hypothetical protein